METKVGNNEIFWAVGAVTYIGWREVVPAASKWLRERKANNPALLEIRGLALKVDRSVDGGVAAFVDAMSGQTNTLTLIERLVEASTARNTELAEEVAARVASPDIPESVKEMTANFEKLMAGQIKACEAIAAEVAGLRETVTAFSKSLSANPELPGSEFAPPDAFMKPGSVESLRTESVLENILRGRTMAEAQLLANEREEQETALSAVDPIS